MSRTLNHRSILIVGLTMALPSLAMACLWDHDTIKMERSRFPTTLELITGKFLRHSPEFYEWRIKNRLARLEKDPNNVLLLDDLAVAYDKTGKHDKAIDTAERIEKLQPGRYETAANLATFLFHAGKIEESLPHVNRAISINPDAHFGREKYQKYLTEYVLKRETEEYEFVNFSKHLKIEDSVSTGFENQEVAVKGVLGMMRFANYRSPVLLEALGDLLISNFNVHRDAKQLASRAYLKASYEVRNSNDQARLRQLATESILMQRKGTSDVTLTLPEVEAEFKKELAEADAWYAELRAKEIGWIRDGLDPEVEFDKLYTTEPEVSGMDVLDEREARQRKQLIMWSAYGIFILSVLSVIFYFWRRSNRGLKST